MICWGFPKLASLPGIAAQDISSQLLKHLWESAVVT
jgi:hypothetical protein